MINKDDIIKINRKCFKGMKFKVISVNNYKVTAINKIKENFLIKVEADFEEVEVIKKSKYIDF